jgi:uncharacterized membrane protein YczE
VRLILPMPPDRRPTRLVLLLAGLVLYGFSSGLMLQAGLGQMPWAVLHQGLSRTFGLSIGTWTIAVGALVLLAWVPLRLKPGIGTLGNVLVLGLALDATLALVPAPSGLAVRVPLLLAGIVLNAVATGAYIGAGLGAGPRDGLSTGLAARGLSLRVVRTSIEVGVLVLGWALGGNVGVGTVLYAATIGVLTHRTIPALRLRERVPVRA